MRRTPGPAARTALLVVALAVSALLVPRATSAQTTAGDLVITPSGGRLRGTVTEYEPGERVTIVLPDGSTRTLGAGEFASVTFADAPGAPGAGSPTPQPAPPAAPESTPVAAPSATSAPGAAPERWDTPRAYGGAAPTSDWVNVALGRTLRRPHGGLHFGVQVEGGFMHALREPTRDNLVLPTAGVFAFLDVTLGERGSFRVGALLDIAGDLPLAGGSMALGWFRTAGVGARLLLGHDVSDDLTFRIGPEVQAVFVRESVGAEIELRLELALRLLEQRNLEIGLGASMGTTPNQSFWSGSTGYGLSLPAINLFVGWVF
jgi:hypothetical protein